MSTSEKIIEYETLSAILMKKLFTIVIALISINAFAQKKLKPVAVRTTSTSDILKTDKRLADFTIRGKKFNVYLSYQKPEEMRQQKKGDTLEMYKIALDKWKFSTLEIVKYATNGDEIIGEGNYSIVKDTLIVTQSFYDYSGAFCITTKYSTDKWGLKKINDDMKGIAFELSERHRKPAKMISPPDFTKQH